MGSGVLRRSLSVTLLESRGLRQSCVAVGVVTWFQMLSHVEPGGGVWTYLPSGSLRWFCVVSFWSFVFLCSLRCPS